MAKEEVTEQKNRAAASLPPPTGDVTEQKNRIVIDPKELQEGTCHVRKLGKGKISICKENGKIKIFEVIKEE